MLACRRTVQRNNNSNDIIRIIADLTISNLGYIYIYIYIYSSPLYIETNHLKFVLYTNLYNALHFLCLILILRYCFLIMMLNLSHSFQLTTPKKYNLMLINA